MCICSEGNGTPLHYSCLENPMDGEAWWAAVHGVTKSWTRLSNFTFTFHFHTLEKAMATHFSGESQGLGAWWAAVCGVARNRTQLKQRSSSSGVYVSVPVSYLVLLLGCLLLIYECRPHRSKPSLKFQVPMKSCLF